MAEKNTKVKVSKFKREERELDMEYPVYLYKQDEFCNDEYIKVTEKTRTTVTSTLFGLDIKVDDSNGCIEEFEVNKVTKKELYDKHLTWAIEVVKK